MSINSMSINSMSINSMSINSKLTLPQATHAQLTLSQTHSLSKLTLSQTHSLLTDFAHAIHFLLRSAVIAKNAENRKEKRKIMIEGLKDPLTGASWVNYPMADSDCHTFVYHNISTKCVVNDNSSTVKMIIEVESDRDREHEIIPVGTHINLYISMNNNGMSGKMGDIDCNFKVYTSYSITADSLLYKSENYSCRLACSQSRVKLTHGTNSTKLTDSAKLTGSSDSARSADNGLIEVLDKLSSWILALA